MQSHHKVHITQLAMATSLVLSLIVLALSAHADSSQQQAPPSASQLASPPPPLSVVNQEQAQGPMPGDDNAQQPAPPQMTMSNSIGGQPVLMAPPQMPLSPSAYPTTFMQASPTQQQVTRLPKINIYASKSEVKKLLGLPNTRIDYVTNGQLNTYPLGFTIPMGYGQSDMIFTWQNLGQTNVNYSISLSIGNLRAVESPLINITRTGLIPRHEQVFKITLPCSGRVSDEIDVQVLFNITGLVPVAALADFGEPGALDDPSGAAAPDASAIQQQNELIAAAVSNASAHLFAAGEQMQADQQVAGPGQEARQKPQMRRVSHTLAIKRKKICTANPVPVIGLKPRQPDMIRPPTQPLPNGAVGPLQPPVAISPAPRPASEPVQQVKTTSPSSAPAVPSHVPGWQDSTIGGGVYAQESPAPQHLPSSSPPTPQAPVSSAPLATAPTSQNQHPSHHNQPRRTEPAWPRSPLGGQIAEPPNSLIDSWRVQPGYANGGGASGNSPLVFTLIAMTLVVLVALVALLVLGSAGSPGPIYGRPSPLDKLRALTNCIWRRTSAGSRAVNKCTKHVGPITIKNGIIGTFGTARHHHNHHQDASANTLGRMRAGGMLHGGTKSTVSSISGLSTISGQNGKLQHAQNANFNSLMGPYYCKQQQPAGNYAGYYGGHHYQQAPDNLLIGTATTTTTNGGFHGGPYHITMSNNQTTKLFLGGNGSNSDRGNAHGHTIATNHSSLEQGNYTIDNSYMPIATTTGGTGFPQPHSDSGSVYQTIY